MKNQLKKIVIDLIYKTVLDYMIFSYLNSPGQCLSFVGRHGAMESLLGCRQMLAAAVDIPVP